MGHFEPYAGIGMGVFFVEDGETIGPNTQVGLRYLVTKNVSVFGEWKYNRASFDFADYSAHIFAVGLGYHIN